MYLISVKAVGNPTDVWINPANIARIESLTNGTVIHFMHGELKHLEVDGGTEALVGYIASKGEQVFEG